MASFDIEADHENIIVNKILLLINEEGLNGYGLLFFVNAIIEQSHFYGTNFVLRLLSPILVNITSRMSI